MIVPVQAAWFQEQPWVEHDVLVASAAQGVTVPVQDVGVHVQLYSPVQEPVSACELHKAGVPVQTPPTPESFGVHVQPEPMQFAW